MNDDIREHNEAVARMLVTVAEYISMSDTKAKVNIGVDFRLKGTRHKLSVRPVQETAAALAAWASREIIKVVKRYQESTGSKEGADLVAGFDRAARELDKIVKV